MTSPCLLPGETDRTSAPAYPLRVGLVCDLAAEAWPSMDIYADVLTQKLNRPGQQDMVAERLQPAMTRRLSRLKISRGHSTLQLVDRIVNRYWDYGRWLKQHRSGLDVFHVVDHTYAHLVHMLPAGRTVVTCHDIDAFLSLTTRDHGSSRLPRRFAARTLSGLQKAARVVCVSQTTRDDLDAHGFLPLNTTTLAYNGVEPVFSQSSDLEADLAISRYLPRHMPDAVDVLHVGSTIQRKRIDVLLKAVGAAKRREPRLRLLKAGGRLTPDQEALARAYNVDVVSLPFLEQSALAALYRHARIVLMTSEREGFGLPLAEAMACGTPVIASDIAIFREVGGDAAVFARVGDAEDWSDKILDLLDEQSGAARSILRQKGLAQARRFSWDSHAKAMATIYRELSHA